MIYLDFDAASFPQRGKGDCASDGARSDAFCYVPVVLRVAGIDLIADNPDADGAPLSGGLPLQLPDVALRGLVALHHVRRSGRSGYVLNEHGAALLFKLSGDWLLIHSTWRERTVQVSHRALLASWEAFDRRVRQFLVETFGDLSDNEWWNRWLHGRLDIAALNADPAAMFYFGTGDDFGHVDAVDT